MQKSQGSLRQIAHTDDQITAESGGLTLEWLLQSLAGP